ncbi:MAG: Rrf2 family transcriptional regulator, partial [Clostridiales Family XIII bacterium]|nr:Rrf2 family transcriptional regulator [Clostridiales Family XIII bacterium]
MLISRETDYAIRIFRELSKTTKSSVTQICEIEDVPKPFAYKILKKLQKQGYVNIHRGKEGGCELIANLDDISLFDLLDALDSTEYVNACLKPNHECEKSDTCIVHKNLCVIQNSVNEKLKETPLSTL